MSSESLAMAPARERAGRIRLLAAGAVTLLATATILGAWGFEKIGGYVPCKLCLEERIPYYAGIPVALVGLVAALAGRPVWLARAALVLVAAIFLVGFGLGTWHAGAEWGWWPGPSDCGAGGGGPAGTIEDLQRQLEGARIVSCTEASWRFPAGWGLSFAGWNAVISAAVAAIALSGAAARSRAA